MMLALTGPLSHQSLCSRIIPAVILQLVKQPKKTSSVLNHKFPCLSNLDFIVTNINFVFLNSVPTCLLIHTTKTLRRMNFYKKILLSKLSQALLDRERDFKRIYSCTFEQCWKQTVRSHANRNRFKLGHHLDVGQKVLYENHRPDLSKSQKLQQRRLGPFVVTKRVTSTTYQIQDNKDPSITKTVHRNQLVEFYPKEESLPAMIGEYVPHDQRHDDFSERFLEQRIGKLNSFTEPLAADPIPFPIRPLTTAPVVAPHKRDSLTSSESGVGSPHNFSPTLPITPEQLPQHSHETETEQPSISAPTRPLTPIKQFLRNNRKSKAREPKYLRPQPHDPNCQPDLRTLTHQG